MYLTDAGREHDSEIAVAVGKYVNATFGALSEHDRRDLSRLLERLGEIIAKEGGR